MNTGPFLMHAVMLATSNIVIQEPQFIPAHDGIQLATYVFMPEQQPENIIIFYHGGGIWSNKLYHAMAQKLCNEKKVGVYLCDIRGHGNSGGPRGDAPSAQAVWQDIDTVIETVRKRYPTSKIFLGGHSSGAGLVLNYSQWDHSTQKQEISGYLLCAPYLGSQSKSNRELKDPSKRFVKDVHVTRLLINYFSGGYFFEHTPVIFFNYSHALKKQDTLVLSYYTCAMSKAVSVHKPDEVFKKIDKPLAVFIGQHDEQFIPEEVINYAKMCKNHGQLITEITPDATHLSIVLDAPRFYAHALTQWGF